MNNNLEEYHLIKEGDLVTIDGIRNSVGIVTEIKKEAITKQIEVKPM